MAEVAGIEPGNRTQVTSAHDVCPTSVFSDDLRTIVFREIDELTRSGGDSLILDLRGCPGGLLDAGLRLAEDFLPRGAVVATVVDADGDETVHLSRRERPYDVKLALLVDENTASAAEV